MLKYLYCKEVFREVPDEISLGISISGCCIHCEGCHSPELWEDQGTPLTKEELSSLLDQHKGVTCLLLLGGEHDITSLIQLFDFVKLKYKIKTAWYSGLDKLPDAYEYMAQSLDYIKLGSYKKELGGLDNPTTNQRLYKLEPMGHNRQYWHPITYKLQNKTF